MNRFKAGLVAAALFALATTAHAGSNAQGPHGGIGAARAMGHGPSAASLGGSLGSPAGAQSGHGGSYWTPDPNASLVDGYQPFPESQMRQFQKP